jgi:hypothetical protein
LIRSFAIIWLFAITGYSANVTIEASIDQSEVSVGGRFTYSVTITGSTNFDKVKMPPFSGFDVVSGPSSSTQIELVNGKMSRSGTHSYVLRAKKLGVRVITPALFTLSKRKSISSNTVSIKVTSAQQSPRSAGGKSNVSSSKRKSRSMPEVFIEAKIDQDSVYKFEMVTVTYDLYFKVNVSNYSFPKIPNAKGFWQEEFRLPSRPKIRDENVRGVAYKVATIRKIGLFPTRAGTLTLSPLTAEITVDLPRKTRSRRRGFSVFDDSFFGRTRSEQRSVSTEKTELTVLGLPKKNKPVHFKGDVGKFNLKVKYDKRELAQHDALNIEVTVNGTGYVHSVQAPIISMPPGFEVFDPTVEESISMSGKHLRGKKVFTYLVIPRRAGTFKLRPVRFSYFDPATGAYRKLKSGGKTIVITPAEDDQYLTGGGMTPEEVTLLGSDIRYIKELTTPLMPKRSKAYASHWFITMMLFSPLLFLLGLGTENIIQNHFSDPVVVRLKRATVSMKGTLKNCESLIEKNEIPVAVVELSQSLSELVGATICEPAAGLTRHSVEAGLLSVKMESELIERVTSLLEEADKIRFSGAKLDNGQAMNLLANFRESASELENLT